MWNIRRGTQLFTLVTFACVGLMASTAGAAGIDMASAFVSGTDVAGPGDEATYTVEYSNLSGSVPVGAYLNVDFPVGAFVNDDEFEIFAEDTLGNVAGLYISSSCENLLVQLQGPGNDEDRPIPLNLPANTSGEVTISMMLPMEQPTTRAVQVQYPGEDYQDLPFSFGSCDDCADLSSCFGPRVSSIIPAIEQEFVIVDDGSGSTGSLGCVSIKNDVAGKIALIRRGECEFGLKAMNAQIAGALGAVIMNNDPAQDVASFVMAGGEFGALVNIPVGIINNSIADPMEDAIEDGQTLMGLMGGVPATSLLFESSIFHSGDTDQDPDASNDSDTFTTTISTGPLPPTAKFSYVADELMVTFTDESTGATSWAWDFGDSESSTEQNPVHTYAADGTYTVMLTATNDVGSSDYSMDVTVAMGGTAPVASFTYTTDQLMVHFMDTSTGATMWDWDFGDGAGTSTEQNPTYTYAEAGTYNVALTASNDIGFDMFTMDVTVEESTEPTLDNFYFIPAAAYAGGAAGSFFVTDADVLNGGTTMATYQFLWLPRDTDNAQPTASEMFTLAAGGVASYANVLSEVFDAPDGALGSLAIISDSMDLYLMSRTFNQAASGTFGQGLAGIAMGDLIPANMKKRIMFLTENDEYRSNLGVMNGTGTPITIMWERFLADGTSLGTGSRQLPAWGNSQLNRVFADVAPIAGGYIHVWTETEGGYFAAYGSVLDATTSDPTTVMPQ